MTTTFDLINEALREVLSGQREQRNYLQFATDDTQTTLTMQDALQGIKPGATLAVGLEMMYVRSQNDQTKTVEVQRADLGTLGSDHNADDLVMVNPRFPPFSVLDAINATLRSLSSPVNGLFQMVITDLIGSSVSVTYDLIGAKDVIDIYDVHYDLIGAEHRWPAVPHWQLLRNQPVSNFASGYALKLFQPVQQGRRVHVLYKAPFGELANLDDDVEFVTGLPSTALDLPALGAQMRLLARREAKRTFTESQPDTRRATEVPVGAATQAYRTLMAEWSRRTAEERGRLLRVYPNKKPL